MGELLRQEFGKHLAGGRVIDVGAGPGAHGGWRRAVHRLRSTSSQWRSSTIGRRIPANRSQWVTRSHLPVASNAVDGVLCVGVIVHKSVVSPVAAVSEMARG